MTNSEYTKNVMANVVEILKERNITPSAFAEMLGLNRSTIHRYINGERSLTAFRVQMFADTLNVPVRQLLMTKEEHECRREGNADGIQIDA